MDLFNQVGFMKARSQIEPAQEQQISPLEKVTTPVKVNRIGVGLAMLALYLIWGSTYLVMRIAIGSIPPFVMGGIRFIVAGALLYTILRMRHTPAPTRAQWIGSAIIGLLLIVGGMGGVAFAEQWVASGLAAVAVGVIPLWTALFIGLMGRWPTRIEWIGLVLGFVGVALLNLGSGLWTSPIGAITLLLSPMCWAFGSALSTRISLPSGLMSSATQMLTGGVMLLLLALVSGERMTAIPTWQSLAALVYLIIFGSLVAFTAYGYLLRNVRPALATSYAYINPIVAVALGVGLAGERITLMGVLALLVILTGVGLVSLSRVVSK
jgi:drug/metabolite transporter (DMT)-like permease